MGVAGIHHALGPMVRVVVQARDGHVRAVRRLHLRPGVKWCQGAVLER
jgi:hypothetical protein